MKSNVAAALIALAAFSAEGATRARYLMGTVCEVTAASDVEIERAFAEAARIESFLSTWRDDSELSRLNRAGSLRVTPELGQLLRRTVDDANRTGGAFNPLVAPLIEVWKTRDAGALPSAELVALALTRVDLGNVRFDGDLVTLSRGAGFEEGAFGKGYAIDVMLACLGAGDAVINFGGQLAVRGATSVTIADPAQRDRPVLTFTLRDGSLSTSSGSENHFVVDGRRFSHILDPRTGQALPQRGSVSVIAARAIDADILSTALYVMGEAEGLRWADAHDVAAIFISPNRTIRFSAPAVRQLADAVVSDRKFRIKD
jgi:thiamine biosynthesis lipoprotein